MLVVYGSIYLDIGLIFLRMLGGMLSSCCIMMESMLTLARFSLMLLLGVSAAICCKAVSSAWSSFALSKAMSAPISILYSSVNCFRVSGGCIFRALQWPLPVGWLRWIGCTELYVVRLSCTAIVTLALPDLMLSVSRPLILLLYNLYWGR